MVGSDDICGVSLQPYTECTGTHQHQFADPEREGRLLTQPPSWATLHPKPEGWEWKP